MGILKGKLVKKDDIKIVNKLDIQAYPWLDFQENDIVFPDNPRRNVILQKFHDPKEMRDKIKVASQFSQSLQKKSIPLYPTDLTKDYEEGLKELIKRKRRRLMGEEEAMALELAEIDATQQGIKFRDGQKKTGKFSKKEFSKSSEKNESVIDEVPVGQPDSKNHFIVTPTVMESSETEVSTRDIPETKNPFPESKSLESDKKSFDEGYSHGFEKGILEGQLEGKLQGIKQGEEKGYLDGFTNGEERAVKAQESKFETVFKNVAHVVEQMEKIKDSLYQESKEVFIEIVKLCTEKILREQVKYSDKALFALFDDVIKSISQKATMNIELNSTDLVRMKNHIQKLGIQDRVTLTENANKESGDFSVESEKGISIAEIHKSVENIIDKLKDDIFSDETTSSPNMAANNKAV